jgi:hypothetical protein
VGKREAVCRGSRGTVLHTGRANAAVLIATVLALLVGTELVLRIVYQPEVVQSAIRYDPSWAGVFVPARRSRAT